MNYKKYEYLTHEMTSYMFCNVYIRVFYTLYTLSRIELSTINRCYNNLHLSITVEILKFIVKLSGDQFKYTTKTTIINQRNRKQNLFLFQKISLLKFIFMSRVINFLWALLLFICKRATTYHRLLLILP